MNPTNTVITASDALVGAVALELVRRRVKPQLDEHHGGFHVLSGFSTPQLAGFVHAKANADGWAEGIQIQFLKSELQAFGVAEPHLTEDSAVGIRGRPRTEKVVVVAELERDVSASLGHSDGTDATDLKDSEFAPCWVEIAARQEGLPLHDELRAQAEAMLRGLFDTGRCPTSKAGEFLQNVLHRFNQGEPLLRAAGKALPIIGLPLFEDCFSSLKRPNHPSQWRERFLSHYKLECYLNKRMPSSGDLLDQEKLREELKQLKNADAQDPNAPVVDDVLLAAFESYIESDSARNSATEHLLFDFDWSKAQVCFEKVTKTSAKDFAERTRKALELHDVKPSAEDETVLKTLERIARKPGTAEEEFRDFLGRHQNSIAIDKPLLSDWENFVHGRRIECHDLLAGIAECLERTIRSRSKTAEAYLVLEGKDQKKPANFFELNRHACEYFERNYASLPARTGNAVRFKHTKVISYSTDVLPKLKETNRSQKKFRQGAGKQTAAATTLKFQAQVYEKSGKEDTLIASLTLHWKFPASSVLGRETSDFDSLLRAINNRKTALVECAAEYEVVGRKGSPLSLSLEAVDGLSDKVGASGRGSFVPAQDKLVSLRDCWQGIVQAAFHRQTVTEQEASALNKVFGDFDGSYNHCIQALAPDALDTCHVEAAVASYRQVLGAITGMRSQELRRQLLQVLLRIGTAQVRRSGKRPAIAIVCPWHPLRLEAAAARQAQALGTFRLLLGRELPPFSDNPTGSLYFRELEEFLTCPLYPELAVAWESNQADPRVVTQAFGGYTLHQPVRAEEEDAAQFDDAATASAATIQAQVLEYLRLQPHERDNFSILLYNCDSPQLTTAVVNCVNKINDSREDKITCQVLLMHRDEEHLRHIYRDLVARGVDAEADSTEASGEFLARVRVNITAASRLNHERPQSVDIAYCRDLISREAKADWVAVTRLELTPLELQPQRWSRRIPVAEGDRIVRLQLTCPAQTAAGWSYLHALASLCCPSMADGAWKSGQCIVLMRSLNFDENRVERIFTETHKLATWVVNQDELLDRKLLEAQRVKVIRYVQSATHGRNLIISSAARDTLIVNTLKEKLTAMLPSSTAPDIIESLKQCCMDDANRISGGLVLKAARRANNTNELLGMVLSRYLILSELGSNRTLAWCFLDDFGQWLGKKEGANMADLLVLAPRENADGSLHLDVLITEAKFVNYDGLQSGADKTSQKQLADTLTQVTEALEGDQATCDQDIWLARLSDLLVAQSVTPKGAPALDALRWQQALRDRKCTVQVWGYSHVFVYGPQDLSAQVSTFRGVQAPQGKSIQGHQEIFGPDLVRELLIQYQAQQHQQTRELRIRNGHTQLDRSRAHKLKALTLPPASVAPTTPPSIPAQPPEPGLAPAPVVTKPVVTQDITPVVTTPSPAREPAAVSTVPSPPAASEAKDSPLIAYLERKVATFSVGDLEGEAWLADVTRRLRQALVDRGLPAKLVEGMPPILTPNAGIIKLQGSVHLTVQAVEAKTEEIYTSAGIKIISTRPESGRVSIAVERPDRQTLHTEVILLNFLRQAQDGERLVVGLREEDGRPLYLDPFNLPHSLVAGTTGSGKSVLIQNLILCIAASRSPDQAHIFLIDPKYGVDYRPLDELPHVKAGSGGIIDTPAAAIQMLNQGIAEMERRYQLFKTCGVKDIQTYRQKTNEALPTWWVIHDEFADWMQTDVYRDQVPDLVNRLGVKARGAGIFLIFAAQRPDKDVMPMQLRDQLGNRLILRVGNAGTSEIAMGERNAGAERLLGKGHMLAKTGATPDPVPVQVPYIDERTFPELVQLITEHHTAKSGAARGLA